MSFISDPRLQQTRILLLGGTSGIGFAVARAALEHGACVILASSKESKVNDAVKRLKQLYPDEPYVSRIAGKKCDLGDEEIIEDEIVALFEFAIQPDLFNKKEKEEEDQDGGKEKVPIDHIVFTAGLIPLVHAPTHPDVNAVYLRSLNTLRFTGGALLAKHAASYMPSPPTSKNSITYTSGGRLIRPTPGLSLGTGMIGAVEGLARGLAVDLAPIRVNTVSLGPVKTEIFDALGSEEVVKSVLEGFEKETVLGVGKPEDAAESYLGLMRDWNVTGALVRSDGGFTLKGFGLGKGGC